MKQDLKRQVCGKKPDGYDHWSLRLLSDTFVTLDNTKVSPEAIRQTLKKTNLTLAKTGMVSDFSPLPPEKNAEFVAAMEDVLDVYTRPEDEKHPLVWMDECPKQLIGETRIPIPAEPGKTEWFDTE